MASSLLLSRRFIVFISVEWTKRRLNRIEREREKYTPTTTTTTTANNEWAFHGAKQRRISFTLYGLRLLQNVSSHCSSDEISWLRSRNERRSNVIAIFGFAKQTKCKFIPRLRFVSMDVVQISFWIKLNSQIISATALIELMLVFILILSFSIWILRHFVCHFYCWYESVFNTLTMMGWQTNGTLISRHNSNTNHADIHHKVITSTLRGWWVETNQNNCS